MKKHSSVMKVAVIVLSGLASSFLNINTVFADELPIPTGKILLTVSGNIANTNSADGAQFDYAMLEDLGLIEDNIITPWTEADSVFTGILTRDLFDLVGVKGDWVRAVAANDYGVTLPTSDLTEHDTLLGLFIDGQRLQLKDKGPVWLVYPNDDRPDVAEEVVIERMIWQLVSLQVH